MTLGPFIAEHEACDAVASFFSMETDGVEWRPTLWDNDGPGRVRVVVLRSAERELIAITSDPETVSLYLDD